MPILFVNGKRRGLKIRGRAHIGAAAARYGTTPNPARKRRKRAEPAGLKRYRLARKRAAGAPQRRGRPQAAWASPKAQKSMARKYAFARRHRIIVDRDGNVLGGRRRKKSVKRGRRARRSTSMARKKRRKGQPAALKRYWAARKRSGKAGRPGKTRRSSSARARAAKKGWRKRKARRATAPKRRKHARRATAPKRRRKHARRATAPKRRRARRSSTSRARAAKKGWRKRRYGRRLPQGMLGTLDMRAMGDYKTKRLKKNPGRKRRGRKGHRRGRRTAYRRYRGSLYRRNPGGMLIDLAKRAAWGLGGFYITRVLVGRVAPMIPGVSSLGTLAGPALSVGAVLGLNFLTKKVGALAKHRNEILLGSAVAALDSMVQAFAPASVKSMVGLSDYIQMGDYVAIGGVPPINDSMTLSDYVAVGGDGVEEELGLEEELGVEEELGNDLLGGVPGGSSLMKRVPSQSFLAPIPARSFTKVIPQAGTNYDNPSQLYGGIFNGGFGR